MFYEIGYSNKSNTSGNVSIPRELIPKVLVISDGFCTAYNNWYRIPQTQQCRILVCIMPLFWH